MDPTASDLPDPSTLLAYALVELSLAPVLLLGSGTRVVAASLSFCESFGLAMRDVVGRKLADVGGGEFALSKLASLIAVTIGGHAVIDRYEVDLIRSGLATRRLATTARLIRRMDLAEPLLMLTINDLTAERETARVTSRLLHEKEVLLQEIQHRVANSLQIVASVLLQSAKRVQSEESRGHLVNAHQRVMSIAAVQRHLAVSGKGEVAVRPYLIDLSRSLSASMIPDPAKLALTVTADGSTTLAETSVSLGLIVTELVINALKHAFPNHRPGTIRVDYVGGPGTWTLTVSDDGVGIAVDPARARPGLGTSLVYALARQLGASVRVGAGRPGTVVTISRDSSGSALEPLAV